MRPRQEEMVLFADRKSGGEGVGNGREGGSKGKDRKKVCCHLGGGRRKQVKEKVCYNLIGDSRTLKGKPSEGEGVF